MDNHRLSKILSEIAIYLEMDGDRFKPRAYEKVAEEIEALPEQVQAIYARGGSKSIENIPGVGLAIAEKIEELLKTGKSAHHQELQKKFPVNLSELLSIGGLGPKKIKTLYETLNIKNLVDLEIALKNQSIANLKGFGVKSSENLLKGLRFIQKSAGRFSLGDAMPEARILVENFRKITGVIKAEIVGSLRRSQETVGGIDILVVSNNPTIALNHDSKLPVMVYVVPEKSYGAALNYLTGSKNHNIALQKIALGKGLELNKNSLYKSEEEIYKILGMQYIPPELREMTGEIELAQKNKLPNLIELKDLKGDLQTQTNWTDGQNSILEMASAAMKVGLEYIVITDHTKRLAMTHGLDERRILEQIKEIKRLNLEFMAQHINFRILSGSECDILKDGTLDLPDEILSQLDVVGISVHSLFNLSRAEQTARIVKAMQNKHADILFHPTGRLINKRPAYGIDIDEIIKVAAATGTVLEIDAFPDRLDLRAEHIRKCVSAGVKMSIDSDAHSINHFLMLEYGVAQARRGWAEKKDIINAWPVETMLEMLK